MQDEMKYVVKGKKCTTLPCLQITWLIFSIITGEIVVKDEVTDETHVLVPGSLLWIPAGAKVSIVSSRDLRTVYFESRLMMPAQSPGTSQAEALKIKLNGLIAKYVEQNPASKKLHDRARQSLPDGSTRSVLASSPFPLSIKSAQGSRLTSVDDKVYVDYVSDFTAGLFGHSNPTIQEAITQAVSNGFSLGAVTELEAELAESLKARFSSIDLIRFCNSGTEANTYALATALAYTGRKKVSS
jgi:glutamate-1-semialdehyde 2,1-aminomutase